MSQSGRFITGGGGGTVTSVSGGNNITITGTATDPIVNVSGTTNHAVQVGNSTGSLTSLALGTSGQILTSNGAGVNPSFQAAPAGGVTINGDVSSVSGAVLTLTGGTSGAVFTGNGTTTMTESFNFLALPTTTATDGQIKINGDRYLHGFGTENVFVGQNSGNFTLSSGASTALGTAALAGLSSGNSNTGIGYHALQTVSTGIDNTSVGSLSSVATNGDGNVSVGYQANTASTSGNLLTSVGYQAGSAYTGAESSNICIGASVLGTAGESNTLRIGTGITHTYISNTYSDYGTSNVFLGSLSGNFTLDFGSSGFNTGIGVNALTSLTTGSAGNTAIGNASLQSLLGSSLNNSVVGNNSCSALQTGSNNTGIGTGLFGTISTGSDNCGIGNLAGFAHTGADSSNICINNQGVSGQSNKLRIGAGTGTGSMQLDAAFISGIFGSTVGVSGVPVVVDNADQLGTVVSSQRYKENIQDMEHYSSRIFNLRPVIYNLKVDESKSTMVGLIAEEVLEAMPELAVVVNDQVETVRYLDLIPMLLNEVQKLRKEVMKLKGE